MNQNTNKNIKYYSVPDVCKLLKINRNQFEYLFKANKLNKDNYRIGGKLLFTESDIEEVRKAQNNVIVYS